MRPSALLLCIAVLSATAWAQHDHNHMSGKAAPQTKAVTGLGPVHHAVSTRVPAAQRLFDQGLAYIYAFNHQEAIRSFREAAKLDPHLAMAYWGISLSLGSNYNLEADAPAIREAYENLQTAVSLSAKASAADRAYIEALSHRYSADTEADRRKQARDYTAAMAALVRRYPNDLDAATLYAESMMNLHPWQLWTPDGKPAENTLEIIRVLEGVLRRQPNHTGANHYYIHATEASPDPQRAIASAKRLATLAPSAGHLVHMPAHVYIRTGDYNAAAQANVNAIRVDEEYVKQNGMDGTYQAIYYNHNIHFLASVSAMNGNYKEAMTRSRQLQDNVMPMVKMMPMIEMFAVYPYTTMLRFRKWDEILREPEPDRDLRVMTCMYRFARGVALAETNRTAEAREELADFKKTLADMPATMPFGNNLAIDLLKVPEHLLEGEIAMSAGQTEEAIKSFKAAVAEQDPLVYNEPPDWDLPAREFLGRALLKSNAYPQAEAVYREELRKHPKNGRALYGLVSALVHQKKLAEAERTDALFKRVWARADTPVSTAAGF